MQVMHVANRSQTKMIYIHSLLRVQFDENAAQLNQTHVENGTTKCSTKKKTLESCYPTKVYQLVLLTTTIKPKFSRKIIFVKSSSAPYTLWTAGYPSNLQVSSNLSFADKIIQMRRCIWVDLKLYKENNWHFSIHLMHIYNIMKK